MHSNDTSFEQLRMHLVQALTRAESEDVEQHLRASLSICDDIAPSPLTGCPVCGKVGLLERIYLHECEFDHMS